MRGSTACTRRDICSTTFAPWQQGGADHSQVGTAAQGKRVPKPAKTARPSVAKFHIGPCIDLVSAQAPHFLVSLQAPETQTVVGCCPESISSNAGACHTLRCTASSPSATAAWACAQTQRQHRSENSADWSSLLIEPMSLKQQAQGQLPHGVQTNYSATT